MFTEYKKLSKKAKKEVDKKKRVAFAMPKAATYKSKKDYDRNKNKQIKDYDL